MTKNLKMKTQEEQKMKIKPFGIIMAFLIVFSSMTTCFAVEYKCLTGYFEGFEGLDDYDEYTNEYGGRIILGGGAEQGSCYVKKATREQKALYLQISVKCITE